jgi:hypothetical protein
MIRKLSHNYCETTRTVPSSLSVGDTTGGDFVPSNTSYRCRKLDVKCPYGKHVVMGLPGKCCLGGMRKAGGEVNV